MFYSCVTVSVKKHILHLQLHQDAACSARETLCADSTVITWLVGGVFFGRGKKRIYIIYIGCYYAKHTPAHCHTMLDLSSHTHQFLSRQRARVASPYNPNPDPKPDPSPSPNPNTND